MLLNPNGAQTDQITWPLQHFTDQITWPLQHFTDQTVGTSCSPDTSGDTIQLAEHKNSVDKSQLMP
jgi:hypothetical protein